ncbi:hypothetical protein TEA_014997 [Camellia sinensis var. sinensis]|uniref:O-fucosyltransferase family protein n=1 Tax=Camellia sinensis var. sinensis TaxID=542762 RepID=A0A4S4EKW2_CAMSN|nr:hypothetical protein TEA_014997 [Camellia sinensis var. sinensis]
MGVAKAWRFGNGVLSNLSLGHLHNKKQHFWSRLSSQRRPVSRSVVCGLMLFALGLISLFTGHVASDLECIMIVGCTSLLNIYVSAIDWNVPFMFATITDAVVVARILNATLVVPELDHHSFWKDDSDFLNIFDVDWFIASLEKDVTIVKRVPDKVMRSMEKPPYTMRIPRKSEPEYYLDFVLPILLRRTVVQLTKFDYRLTNDLDDELQKLRCRVNYHALRFTKSIRLLGQKLVSSMRKMTNRFIAIHLRFEPDMLAFSGCYYGGGDKERNELGEIRKRWTTLPDLSAEEERKRGKCPLTPHEVGLMLRALGFRNDTYLYVASGEIYGGEETLQPLRELFPNFYTKDMLASEELKPFLPFSSRLAAVDYIVCEESDVFITNNKGNMAKILAGRSCRSQLFPYLPRTLISLFMVQRRYMGHKRTIRPNAKKLSALFMARDHMDWDTFATKVKSCQRGFMGEPEEMRPGHDEFHEYPSACICKKPFNYSDVENDDEGDLTSKEPSQNQLLHIRG